VRHIAHKTPSNRSAEEMPMRSSRILFFALVLAGPAILFACAIAIILAALLEKDPVWRQTEFDLKAAVETRSRVAAKVLADRTENIDIPVLYSGREVGRDETVPLAPLVIAVLLGYDEMVRILLDSGSNPAVAFSTIPPDVAVALRRYAAEREHKIMQEYLARYSPGPELR